MQAVSNQGPSGPKLLGTIRETSHDLNLSPRSIWRLIAQEELSVVRCNRAVRVTRESIEAFIKKGGTPR